jgi:DNA-binding transcriptional LysR family regulator
MELTVRQVRAFLTVVEQGTFTDAAIKLGTSQATVSRSVAALEDALGARLLRRSSHGVTLTAIGKRALTHATRMLADVAQLEQTARTPADVLRLGYAWSALGRHTTDLQRQWGRAHPGTPLDLVQSNTRSAGLLDGLADVAVVRVPLDDARFESTSVGLERRYAALASDDPLARRRRLRLADFDGRVVAVEAKTGSTTLQVWSTSAVQVRLREVHTMEEWLILIAAGQAVGMTPEATVLQHPRPGVVYRPVVDAEPVAVRMAWWRDEPPVGLGSLLEMVELCTSGSRYWARTRELAWAAGPGVLDRIVDVDSDLAVHMGSLALRHRDVVVAARTVELLRLDVFDDWQVHPFFGALRCDGGSDLLDAESAVDDDCLTGDVVRRIGGEEDGGTGHFFWLRPPTLWDDAPDVSAGRLVAGRGSQHVGLDESGPDGVDLNIF